MLRAAFAAFARAGFDSVNLREVARDADVDVALIAHHFGTKLDLWKAVVDALAARFATWAEMDQSPAGRSPEARLTSAIGRFIEIASEMPEYGMFVTTRRSNQASAGITS